MPEYTVSPQQVSRDDEMTTAEFYRHDEAAVQAAKEAGARILVETLGIDSNPEDWRFNCGSDFVWVHIDIDGLPITVHIEDYRRTHEGRIFARLDPGGQSVARDEWIRSLYDLDEAIRQNRYYKEHPYVKGPYGNLD